MRGEAKATDADQRKSRNYRDFMYFSPGLRETGGGGGGGWSEDGRHDRLDEGSEMTYSLLRLLLVFLF